MGLMPHGTDMPREWGEPGKRDNRFGDELGGKASTVFSDAFHTYGQRFWIIIFAALLVEIIPLILLFTVIFGNAVIHPAALFHHATYTHYLRGKIFIEALVVEIVSVVLSTGFVAFVTEIVRDEQTEDRRSFGQLMAASFSPILGLIAIGIIEGIIGAIVIAIPAYFILRVSPVAGLIYTLIVSIFLAVRLFVVIPTYVIERPGVFGAFELGWQLTKGVFWRVLLVIITLTIIILAIGVGAFVVLWLLSRAHAPGIVLFLFRLAVLILLAPIEALVIAQTYFVLRGEHDE